MFRSPRAREILEKRYQGVPLDQVLETYANHREKYKEVNKVRMSGWEDPKYEFEKGFNPLNPFYLNRAYGNRYNQHNTEEVILNEPYWDSKENDNYWQLSKWQRTKLHFKNFFEQRKDILLLNFFLLGIFVYYADKKSKQVVL